MGKGVVRKSAPEDVSGGSPCSSLGLLAWVSHGSWTIRPAHELVKDACTPFISGPAGARTATEDRRPHLNGVPCRV